MKYDAIETALDDIAAIITIKHEQAQRHRQAGETSRANRQINEADGLFMAYVTIRRALNVLKEAE